MGGAFAGRTGSPVPRRPAGEMTRFHVVAGLILGLTALACVGVRGEDAAPEPSGYRTHDYRAPTPAGLSGARVVTTPQAEALWRDKAAIFVDVMPRPPPRITCAIISSTPPAATARNSW